MKYKTIRYENIGLDVVINENIEIVDIYPIDSQSSIKAVISDKVLDIISNKLKNLNISKKDWIHL